MAAVFDTSCLLIERPAERPAPAARMTHVERLYEGLRQARHTNLWLISHGCQVRSVTVDGQGVRIHLNRAPADPTLLGDGVEVRRRELGQWRTYRRVTTPGARIEWPA